MQRQLLIHEHYALLKNIQRGIEREAIRIDQQGNFALDAHPKVLGSALTHPHITTDYAEALLELITDPHDSVESLLAQLQEVHAFVQQNLNGQMLWGQSMPCHLPNEQDIPIAEYGSSNSGKLRHVYREGLAVRYGKKMQCIAGLHYNFSLPEELWQILPIEGDTPQDRQNNGYMGLIRNFKRYSWLLMYLFGASPAVNGSFLNDAQKATLSSLTSDDGDSYFLPYATSLRMSDLGYTNDAQSNLKSCFNDIEGFSKQIFDAVSTPWPAYEAIGTHRNGQWIQLNTNILQIENEFYATIRPKRSHGRGERPITALMQHGVQYIEVRCIDINPFNPLGIDESTCRFLDTFLLFCAAKESPLFPEGGECAESNDNFQTVVTKGRQPGLMLKHHGEERGLQDWGISLINELLPFAQALDKAYGTTAHIESVTGQIGKLLNSMLCPSSRVLSMMQQQGKSFNQTFLETSSRAAEALKTIPLSAQQLESFKQQSAESLAQQTAIELSDNISFEEYLQNFMNALTLHPTTD